MRPADMWRYREFLPLGPQIEAISLGETTTPLISLPALEKRLGCAEVWVKDGCQPAPSNAAAWQSQSAWPSLWARRV